MAKVPRKTSVRCHTTAKVFPIENFSICPAAVTVVRFHFASKHFNAIVITRIASPLGQDHSTGKGNFPDTESKASETDA